MCSNVPTYTMPICFVSEGDTSETVGSCLQHTGKYDVNALKVDFFTRLLDSHKIKYTVKQNNNFMCIKTEKLKFLDIANYLAPGFS